MNLGKGWAPAKASLAAIALVLAGVGTLQGMPQSTYAAWIDPVDANGTTLTADTIPPPTLSCSGGILSVTFNWTSVPGATNYTLFYNGGASSTTVAGTSTSISGVVNLSSTAFVRANRNFASTTWTSVNSNTRNYTFLVVSLCS